MATAKQPSQARQGIGRATSLASQRKRELEKYFSGIRALEDFTTGKTEVLPSKVIEDEFMKIVKASSFLLLYNYVEGCVTEAFLGIYRAIQSEKLEYENLCTELRSIWIDFKSKPLLKEPTTSHVSYTKLAAELVDGIVDRRLVEMDRKALPVSGNLNEQKIRHICEAHGVKLHTKLTKVEDDLEIVMSLRNELAHGSTSFAECGRDYVVADLERINENATEYIDLFLESVDTYIGRRRYGKVN